MNSDPNYKVITPVFGISARKNSWFQVCSIWSSPRWSRGLNQNARTWNIVQSELDFPKSAVRGSWKRRTFVTRKRAKFTGAFLLRWRQWMLINSELKQVTFLTTRTAWVTSEDWVKGCDWWKTSTLLPVDVRVVKNVTCLSSLLFCTNDAIWHGERPVCHNWFSRQIFH